MDKASITNKLAELKKKQKMIDAAWLKTGNRKLMHFFVELIPKALNVERCSIFILDPKEEDVWLQCGTGLKERQIKVPQWSSMVGRVISTGELAVEEDMENVVGAHDTVDVKTGFVSRDSLCVPVKGVSFDKVTGAIQVLNKRGGRGYTDEDQEILEKMAFHLQMHIESIYMRQEMGKISSIMGKQILLLEQKLYQASA